MRQQVSASREQRFCYRALCVLLIAEGHRPNQVAEWLGEHTRTLERWRKRFTDNGLDGLIDDVAIWDTKISSGAVKLMAAGFATPDMIPGFQKLTDTYVGKIGDILDRKQKEILEV